MITGDGTKGGKDTATAPVCTVCQTTHNSRMLTCTECNSQVHVTCLGLGRNAYPAGIFMCADCVKNEAKLPNAVPEQAKEAAHMLVWLKGNRVAGSSQDTYASGLHRYIRFLQATGISLKTALPGGKEGMNTMHIQMFISWAASRYKFNTINTSLSALADWHRSKGISADPVSCMAVKQLMQTVKTQQGPAGLPVGKTGMTKAMLRLLIAYLNKQQQKDPEKADIYLRDICWVLVGFYGLLRRSEIIALQLQDVTVNASSSTPYVEVRIRKSKTDRRGEGAVVTITGVTRDNIPLATYIQQWLKTRAAHNPKPEDALFTKWDLDRLSPTNEPIKHGQTLALRLQGYLIELKRRYPELTVNPASYGMHSLRRGGVMAAWMAGVDIEKIKAHGRWKSDAVRAYMHTTRRMRLQITSCM